MDVLLNFNNAETFQNLFPTVGWQMRPDERDIAIPGLLCEIKRSYSPNNIDANIMQFVKFYNSISDPDGFKNRWYCTSDFRRT